jgi:hypothetical protein
VNNSNSFLSLCEKLQLSPSFALHEVVARGFADVGYESFAVLPGRRLLSLFTGKITPLQEQEAEFFFLVPDVEHLLLRAKEESLFINFELVESGVCFFIEGKQYSCPVEQFLPELCKCLIPHLEKK